MMSAGSFSIADTISYTTGTQLSALYREVSLIQRLACPQLYVRSWDCSSVPISELPLPTQGVLRREVPP